MRPTEPAHDVHARAMSIVGASTMEERQRVLEESGLDARDPRLAVLVAERIAAHRLAEHHARTGGDRRG